MIADRPSVAALLGTWQLTEWTARADGTVDHPFTAQATGRLMYGADGLMAAFLQSPRWAGSPADFTPQRTRFIAYSGQYEINENAIRHHVDAASDPRWIGSIFVRPFTMNGDMLIIETQPTSDFGIGRFHHRLCWTR